MQVSNFNDESGRPISALFSHPIPPTPAHRALHKKTDVPEGDIQAVSEALFRESVQQLLDTSFSAADLDRDDRSRTVCMLPRAHRVSGYRLRSLGRGRRRTRPS